MIKINDNLVIKQNFISIKRIRPATKYKKNSLTIHSTANPKSTALNELGWLSNPQNKRVASWHFAVDDKEIWQAIPVEETTYHASKREGNLNSISIEICESGDRLKTLLNTIELIKYLKKQYNISKIYTHNDWSGKNCPRVLIDKSQVKDGLDFKWFMSELEKKEVVELDWKQEIIKKSLELGLITDKEWLNKSEEKATVWFVLAVANNLFKLLKK